MVITHGRGLGLGLGVRIGLKAARFTAGAFFGFALGATGLTGGAFFGFATVGAFFGFALGATGLTGTVLGATRLTGGAFFGFGVGVGLGVGAPPQWRFDVVPVLRFRRAAGPLLDQILAARNSLVGGPYRYPTFLLSNPVMLVAIIIVSVPPNIIINNWRTIWRSPCKKL